MGGAEAGRVWTAGKAVAWPVQTILQRKQQVIRHWEARRGVSGDEILCCGSRPVACDPEYAPLPRSDH